MNWQQPEVYAVKHKDEKIRAESRSGGMFTALSDKILEYDGVIYGCILTEDFRAVHIRTENKELRNRMRGSKYIQSRLGDIFKDVKSDLNSGRMVLFSGTSCQVAGLNKFLEKEYDNLLCVDIVCHGVPSPLVWKKYLGWQENRAHAKVVSVDFRNKKDFGWRAHVETLILENGRPINSKVFAKIFYGHASLRPCCYECPYKSTMHPSDVTLADYWGIEKAAIGFDDNKGVSLVLVNNYKGKAAFQSVMEDIVYQSTKLEDSIQPPLKTPFPRPDNREIFWRDFKNMEFGNIAVKYGGNGVKNKLLNKVKNISRETLNLLKRK